MPVSAPVDFDRADAVLRSTMAGSNEHHLALIRRAGMGFDWFPWPPPKPTAQKPVARRKEQA